MRPAWLLGMMPWIARITLVLLAALLAACSSPSDLTGTGQALATAPAPATQDVTALASEITSLGPGISPAEAQRAAQVALDTSGQLAIAYGVTDPPLVHNTKVNMGLRPRGLCYHWADDLEAKLRQEGFQTLTLHRAIANADTPFRIDHSTVILGRRGDPMERGIVLDPWRRGGDLFWAPVAEDTSYSWVPRAQVFAAKRDKSRERLATRAP